MSILGSNLTFKPQFFSLLGLLALFLPLHVAALEPLYLDSVQLNQNNQPYPITNQLTYYEDKDGSLSASHAFDDITLEWQTHGDEIPSFGITESVYWWRIKITNNIEDDEWMLVIGYPLLDKVDLHIQRDGFEDEREHISFGDHYLFDERQVSHRMFLHEMDIKKGDTYTIYIRIESKSPIQGPLAIWPKTLFFLDDQDNLMSQSFYYGGMLIMALFNLIIFIFVKDLSYFYYVSFVFFQAVFQAAIHGFGYQFLWPNSPNFQQVSTVFALNMSMAYAGLFFGRLLELRQRKPKAAKFILFLSIFLFLQALLIFFAPYIWSLRISIVTVSLLALSSIFIALPMSLQNIAEARLFVIGWGVMILGGWVLAMDKTGMIPPSIITENGFQLGSLIEVVLLSLAMANQINKERKKRFMAQEQALMIQRDANENLEHKVQERTQELELLNARLDEMSRTDALTGVLNRRAFEQIYRQETEFCHKNGIVLSILILDIDHFKKINDNYGHESGDECLRVVGQLLQDSVDGKHAYVTRYGGEEFVISMRGVDAKEAQNHAERIRQSVESSRFQTKTELLTATMSIGVASGVPNPNVGSGLLHYADEALYKAKNNGRNQVQIAELAA